VGSRFIVGKCMCDLAITEAVAYLGTRTLRLSTSVRFRLLRH
jgi:hypothetical protein